MSVEIPMRLDIYQLDIKIGSRYLLNSVTISLKQHDSVLLTGRNGAGKTTLLDAISGLIKYKNGRIAIDGIIIDNIPSHKRAKLGLGRVFQSGGIFRELTVNENLSLATNNKIAKSQFLCTLHGKRTINAWQKNDSIWQLLRSAKIDSDLNKFAGSLSQGQQRFLAVLIAFLGKSKILLLDEPFSGLSNELRSLVCELLKEFTDNGGSVLIVEHEQTDVQFLTSWTIKLSGGHLELVR